MRCGLQRCKHAGKKSREVSILYFCSASTFSACLGQPGTEPLLTSLLEFLTLHLQCLKVIQSCHTVLPSPLPVNELRVTVTKSTCSSLWASVSTPARWNGAGIPAFLVWAAKTLRCRLGRWNNKYCYSSKVWKPKTKKPDGCMKNKDRSARR